MNAPIPVLYLIDFLNIFSGTERHLYNLVEHIDKTRFRPLVVTFRGMEEFKQRIERLGVPVRILNMSKIYGKRQLRMLFELKKFAEKEDIKIIQTFHTNPDLYGTVLAKLSGIPVVISSRRDMGFCRNKRNLLCYRFLNRYVDKIVCVSDKVKGLVMREEGVREEKIRVIHNGIDPAHLDRDVNIQAERGRLGILPAHPVVGMLANFNPIKGHSHFLEACRIIKNAVPEARFVLAGRGPVEGKMKEKARELGLWGCMHFMGYREDIAEVLSVMDVLVAPSLSEGFSNSIIEALYLRRPVIATSVGGNPEAVVHNETGVLVSPGNPGEIACAAIKVLNDKNFSLMLGENGRKLVQQKFLLNGMMDKTMRLYDELLALKGLVGAHAAYDAA